MKLHWILAALALLTLLMFGVFLWWFGPWHAPLGFGLWAVLTAPLLVIAYRVTRRRWLLYLGSGLFCWGVVVGLFGSPGSLWGETAGLAVVGLSCAVPLVVTAAWLPRAVPHPIFPAARWSVRSIGPLVAAAAVMAASVMWARAETVERRANPSFAKSFAGCYEIEFGTWIPSSMLGHGVHGIVPPRIQLDTVRGHPAHRSTMYDTFERFQFLIRPGWWGSAIWKPMDAQHVDLVWNTGFHGVSLRMRRDGAELRGRAIGHTDVGGLWPEPRALVRAYPIDCDLVPADTVRVRRETELPQPRKNGRP